METLPLKNALEMVFMLAARHLHEEKPKPENIEDKRIDHKATGPSNRFHGRQMQTVEGLLSQKASRQMLQASSQASCTPPSTNAAAEDSLLSILAFSSISATSKTGLNSSSHDRFLHPKAAYFLFVGSPVININQHGINRKKQLVVLNRLPKRQQTPKNEANPKKEIGQNKSPKQSKRMREKQGGWGGYLVLLADHSATKRHRYERIPRGIVPLRRRRRRDGDVAVAPGPGERWRPDTETGLKQIPPPPHPHLP
jgi:hypothetical protein